MSQHQGWMSLVYLGFSRYDVNEDGEIRNAKTGKIVKPYIDPSGRISYLLYHDDRERQTRISRSKLMDWYFGFDKP